jgi:Beta-glucosidase-related glycosidases
MNRDEARRKAKELVSKMTLEEKASQLKYDSPSIKRLGIPDYNWWNEALHGVARAGVATSFPQAIGMAATFDDSLLKDIADAIATEARAKYNEYNRHGDHDIYKGLTFWSPNVNIFRDPRWGRGHETYGEDPYLTSRLGNAFVKGLQGDGEYLKTAACAKHFAVHSGPEADRHSFNAIASKKDMYETYLPAFKTLVKESKVEAVMGAYNRTNGEPCCGSNTLIKDILRGEWEFEGHFVSDCWALKDFHMYHGVTSTAEESAAMAIKAGCDVNCGNIYLYLLKALQNGLITEDDITRAAERLFTTRFLLGMFDETEYDKISYEMIECKEHIQLADKATEKSLVLLKNNGILPIQKDKVNTIGVIGPNANSRAALIGNYYGTSSEYITILEGIKKEAGEDIRVLYSDGCHLYKEKTENLAWDNDRISEAVIVAEHSDIVILCLGLDETLEGEEGDEGNNYASGDKNDLQLPKVQRTLLEAVVKTGKPVVLCVSVGSAMDLNYAEEHVDGILLTWYPGARGGSRIAKTLFGNNSPSGKLPVTFYKDLDDLPSFTDYTMENRTYRFFTGETLYPFGYGLTYGNCNVIGADYKDGFVEAEIQNESDMETDEVVQVYIKNLDSSLAVRNHNLCAFKRVSLQRHETIKVKLPIAEEAFLVVNEEGKYVEDGKRFKMYVGFGQPDERTYQLTKKKSIEIDVTK